MSAITPASTYLLASLHSLEEEIRAAIEDGAPLEPIDDALADVESHALACPAAHLAQLDTLLHLIGSMLFCVRSASVPTTREAALAYLHSAALTASRARALVSLTR